MHASSLAKIIAKRLAAAVPSLAAVVVVTFLLTRALPGDPAAFFAGPAATREAVEEIRERLGLNRSWPAQFAAYVGDLASGNLGASLTTGQPVLADIAARLPASLELTLVGLAFATVVGVPLGIQAAARQGGLVDHVCRVVGTLGVSLPVFFTGLLLVYVFYYLLGVAPAPMGRLDAFSTAPRALTGFLLIDCLLFGESGLWGVALHHLMLPALTLGLFAVAPLARMTRAAMLGALGSDAVRAATAYGLGRTKVLYGRAFRICLSPVLTTMGMIFSFLLGANVLVEKVFSWPGIGSYALEALIASDYAPVQGFILTMAVLYVCLNLFIDLAVCLLDPRAKVAG